MNFCQIKSFQSCLYCAVQKLLDIVQLDNEFGYNLYNQAKGL